MIPALRGTSRALALARPLGEAGGAWLAGIAFLHAAAKTPAWKVALQTAAAAAEAMGWCAAGQQTGWLAWVSQEHAESLPTSPWNAARKAARRKEEAYQADLLRHIVGNPFHPLPPTNHLPLTVVCLAEALYNGQECAFALHDALLEAGQSGLAEHFRQEQEHPKGCWAVDLILGKC